MKGIRAMWVAWKGALLLGSAPLGWALCVVVGSGLLHASAVCSDPMFMAPSYYGADDARGVAVGDIDGDGMPDVLVTGAGSIRAFKNIGSGGLQPIFSSVGSGAPRSIAVGDFDHDGRMDWCSVNTNGILDVWMNKVGGVVKIPLTISGRLNAVYVYDVDRDGFHDIALTAGDFHLTDTKLVVLWNDGAGQFSPQNAYIGMTGATIPVGASMADFDDDGLNDFVVVSTNRAALLVYMNLGDRMFQKHDVETSTRFTDVMVADWNRDGNVDVLTTGNGNGLLSLYWGLGNGNFAGPLTAGAGIDLNAVGVGYFNEDDIIDAVTANYGSASVSVIINDGNGGIASITQIAVVSGPYDVATNDLDVNQSSDLVVSAFGDSMLCVLRNVNSGYLSDVPHGNSIGSRLNMRVQLVYGRDPILFLTGIQGSATICVFDVQGRVVGERQIDSAQGVNGVKMPGSAMLPSGLYVVRARSGNETSWQKAIVGR